MCQNTVNLVVTLDHANIFDIIGEQRAEISRLNSELANARELLKFALAEVESVKLLLEIEKDYE